MHKKKGGIQQKRKEETTKEARPEEGMKDRNEWKQGQREDWRK